MINKHIFTYKGSIGSEGNPYLALEKKLTELVILRKLGIVSDNFLGKEDRNKFIFYHFKSGVYLSYDSSPSSFGRNEDLSIVFDSIKISSKELGQFEQWMHQNFKDFFKS